MKTIAAVLILLAAGVSSTSAASSSHIAHECKSPRSEIQIDRKTDCFPRRECEPPHHHYWRHHDGRKHCPWCYERPLRDGLEKPTRKRGC